MCSSIKIERAIGLKKVEYVLSLVGGLHKSVFLVRYQMAKRIEVLMFQSNTLYHCSRGLSHTLRKRATINPMIVECSSENEDGKEDSSKFYDKLLGQLHLQASRSSTCTG